MEPFGYHGSIIQGGFKIHLSYYLVRERHDLILLEFRTKRHLKLTNNQTGRVRRRSPEMGQSLSEPRTEKRTSTCENDMFLAATSSMQGWRIGIHSSPFTRRSQNDGGIEG